MKRKTLLFLFIISFIFSACKPPENDPEVAETSQSVTMEPTSSTLTSTATLELEEKLTVCTASLPASLFPYDGENAIVKEHILAMIQDAPFDLGEDGLEPGILERVPTQDNSSLRLQRVTVQNGQVIVDANGEIAVLNAGVIVRPSGCRQSDCAITWDGEGTLDMDQMVIEFQLRDDLYWSDGTAVKAADSVFSFELASASEVSGLQWEENRTAVYTAPDDVTVEWVGLPGFTSAEPEHFFWTPLPSHLFTGGETWTEIAGDEQMMLYPLSYGPFVLSSREENIFTFTPNPYYYRSDEGLPVLDEIIFRADEGGAEEAWTLLKSGDCDVLDSSLGLENERDLLKEVLADENFDILLQPSESWIQLVFGIQPVTYDGRFNIDEGDRPDFFGDERTRQAIAMSLDRAAMLAETTLDLGTLWASFLSPSRSLLEESGKISYDLETALQLLNEVGWRDHDENPETPLQAWEVANVPAGTQFVVELLVSQSAFQQDVAEIISSSLQEVGIVVNITILPAEALYAPGPGGVLFGRQFDLALISWQPAPTLDCSYYFSWQIPSTGNQWIGTNVAGLSNGTYDQLCSDASLVLPAEYASAIQLSEKSFLEYLPAVPLLSNSGIMVMHTSDCVENDFADECDFYSLIETFQRNLTCP